MSHREAQVQTTVETLVICAIEDGVTGKGICTGDHALRQDLGFCTAFCAGASKVGEPNGGNGESYCIGKDSVACGRRATGTGLGEFARLISGAGAAGARG